MIFSNTQLRRWRDCQRSYFYEYVVKREATNPYADFLEEGRDFHLEMELWFKEGIPAKYVTNEVKSQVEALFSKSLFAEKIYQEKPICYQSDGTCREGEPDNDTIFWGVVDLAFLINGELNVIEYKSGFRVDFKEDEEQLYSYAYMLSQITNPSSVKVYIITHKNFIFKQVSSEELYNTFKKILQKIEKIQKHIEKFGENESKYATNVGGACVVCRFREYCEAFKNNANAKDWVDKPLEMLVDIINAKEMELEELKELFKRRLKENGLEVVKSTDGKIIRGFIPYNEMRAIDTLEALKYLLQIGEIERAISFSTQEIKKIARKYPEITNYFEIVQKYRFGKKNAEEKENGNE